MTPQEAFKIGFLLKCAEDGCSSAQTARRVKLAANLMGVPLPTPKGVIDTGKAVTDAGASTMSAIWKSLLAAGLLGGAAGAGGGYMLAGAMDDSVDPADARDAETLAEYQRAIQELSRRRQLSGA